MFTHIHCECNCILTKGILIIEILLSHANIFIYLFPLCTVHFHMLFCNLLLFVDLIGQWLKFGLSGSLVDLLAMTFFLRLGTLLENYLL